MGHWVISSALEPIYVDDKYDNPNYDPRTDDMDCMMCPCSLEECDKRETCYWDEVWETEEDEVIADGEKDNTVISAIIKGIEMHIDDEECDGDDGRYDYWHDSAEQAGWFDKNGDWHPYEESEV